MLPRHNDPIAAIATAPGRGAVGIVRVSGKGVAPLVRVLCGRDLKPREATYLPLRDAAGGPIDHGLALFFPAPHSYTGEDVLELQAHGGPVVLQLLLARCLEAAQEPLEGHRSVLPGLRLAQPGEFTERAFLNDKIDLAQAEAIADLIDASTEAAARSASRSLSGAFSEEIHGLRDALVHLRKLDQVLSRAHQGALLREGIKVVIAGQPNAGKSSLLNALAGAELAIVTPIAGTTRDKVQQTIQIEGVPLHVIDTAGLRESSDEVERIGIARAWEEIAAADAVLFLHDLTRMGDNDYLAADAAIAETLAQKLPGQVPVIDVWNKTDRAEPAQLQVHGGREGSVALSARTGDGLDALRRRLLDVAGWQSAPEGLYLARARHVEALQAVAAHLEEAELQLAAQAAHLDLLAEELRLAQVSLNSITGEFSSDDLLGVIFSSFCIGK
jgi:tRNA modification GTPase